MTKKSSWVCYRNELNPKYNHDNASPKFPSHNLNKKELLKVFKTLVHV